MPRFQDIVTDNEGNGLPGAIVTVRDYPSGNLSTLTADSGGSLTNPIVADLNGAYYFNAANAIYSLEFRLLAYEPAREVRLVNLGNLVDSVTLAATTGAALIGTTHSGTLDVQLDALLGKNLGMLPTGSTNSLDVERTASSAVDGTTQWYAEQRRIYAVGTNSFDYARANYNGTHYQATGGTCANLEGEHRYIWHEGLGGTVTSGVVYGGHCRVDGGSVTNEIDIFRCVSTTLGASASVSRIVGFSVGDIGDVAKVQDVIGVDIPNLLGANSAIGVKINIAASANKWAIYSEGAAQSVHSGNIRIGSVVAPTEALDVTGNIKASGEITSTALRIGYSAGAGGAVTQATSKSTAPPAINKPTGQITLNAAALAANAVVTLTVSNSRCASTDVVIVNVQSGMATPGTYEVWASNIANGSFGVNLRNISAGSLSEALIINFAVIKGANV